jgi:hypothetical protein
MIHHGHGVNPPDLARIPSGDVRLRLSFSRSSFLFSFRFGLRRLTAEQNDHACADLRLAGKGPYKVVDGYLSCRVA